MDGVFAGLRGREVGFVASPILAVGAPDDADLVEEVQLVFQLPMKKGVKCPVPLCGFRAHPVEKRPVGSLLPGVGRITEPSFVGETLVHCLHELFDTPLLDIETAQEAVDTAVPLRRGDRPVARVVVGVDQEVDVIAIQQILQSGFRLQQSTGRGMAAGVLRSKRTFVHRVDDGVAYRGVLSGDFILAVRQDGEKLPVEQAEIAD